MIRHVCAVCGKVYGYTDSFGAPGGDSHGYCNKHYAEAREAAGLDVETYDEPPHDPEKCDDMRCEEPECIKSRVMFEADRRYDEMRDREMEEKQLRQRSAYPAFRSMRRSGHE